MLVNKSDIIFLRIIILLWIIISAVVIFSAKPKQTKQIDMVITENGKEQVKEIIKYVERDIHTLWVSYDMSLVKTESDIIELDGITITSYNNKAEQTDDTPHIMASNRMVYEGAVAISRDLKSKYDLKYGDILEHSTRFFVIEDLMNERYKNRIDIFSFDKEYSKNIHFKNQSIKIYKLKR